MLYITATIAVGQRCAGSDARTLTARQDHCASSQVKTKDQALTVKRAHISIKGFKGLLRVQAIERGEGDGSHWHASKESLIQARADEKTIQELLAEIYAKQQVPCRHHPACLLQQRLRVSTNVAPTTMCCNCPVSPDLQHVFCHAWLTCCASTVRAEGNAGREDRSVQSCHLIVFVSDPCIRISMQGRLSAALAVAEANADRAEQIEKEAATAQLQFAKVTRQAATP